MNRIDTALSRFTFGRKPTPAELDEPITSPSYINRMRRTRRDRIIGGIALLLALVVSYHAIVQSNTEDAYHDTWGKLSSTTRSNWCTIYRSYTDAEVEKYAEDNSIDWSAFRPVLQEHC